MTSFLATVLFVVCAVSLAIEAIQILLFFVAAKKWGLTDMVKELLDIFPKHFLIFPILIYLIISVALVFLMLYCWPLM